MIKNVRGFDGKAEGIVLKGENDLDESLQKTYSAGGEVEAEAEAEGTSLDEMYAKVKANKLKPNEAIINLGSAIIASMDEEESKNLSSKSNTLHFQHQLGLASTKSTRAVTGGATLPTHENVGVTLKTDIDIIVPRIHVLKDKTTGINPETDITYEEVKAGTIFDLTNYEFMYLIIRDEYAGFCEYGGAWDGVFFTVKTPPFFNGKAKLPTPTINFRHGGSPKEGMVFVDYQDTTTKEWKIKPEYYDKFGPLLKESNVTKNTKGPIQKANAVAVALQKILNAPKVDPTVVKK